jgi:hypothetical protein
VASRCDLGGLEGGIVAPRRDSSGLRGIVASRRDSSGLGGGIVALRRTGRLRGGIVVSRCNLGGLEGKIVASRRALCRVAVGIGGFNCVGVFTHLFKEILRCNNYRALLFLDCTWHII